MTGHCSGQTVRDLAYVDVLACVSGSAVLSDVIGDN